MERSSEYNDLKEAGCTLMSWLKMGLSQGCENANVEEMESVVNMVHHIAEAKRNCMEAKYYETVVEAMEEGGEEGRYGYNSYRMSNGQYAPKGSGSRVRGYRPYLDQEPYIDGYLNDPYFRDNMKYGYAEWKPMMDVNPSHDERYGKAYNDYQTAKRHYTETNSRSDKEEMTTHAMEHVNDTISTLRDIWKSADPELKKRMKTDLTNLTTEMVV